MSITVKPRYSAPAYNEIPLRLSLTLPHTLASLSDSLSLPLSPCRHILSIENVGRLRNHLLIATNLS